MTLLIEHTDVAPVTIEVTHKRLPELPTIKRSDLIWAAEETLHTVNANVPPALAGYVMEVARTANYISPWWQGDGTAECGCLIGTARMSRGYSPLPSVGGPLPGSEHKAESAVGCWFIQALTTLIRRQRITWHSGRFADVYRVVD